MIKVPSNRPGLLLSVLVLGGLAGCGKPGGPAASPGAPPEAPPAMPPALPMPVTFERTLEWQGFSFRVSSPNDSSLSTVTVAASGLAAPVEPLTREVDGTVVGAAVADLDSNGLPEVYVFGRSAGSGSYGSVIGLAVNADRATLAELAFPAVAENPQVSAGYMGHDAFEVVGNSLVQRFPVYLPGDSNAAPTGKTREIQYALDSAGASPALRVGGVTEH